SELQIAIALATVPIATMVAPMFVGQAADRWVASEKLLAILNLGCGVILLLVGLVHGFLPFVVVFGASMMLTVPLFSLATSLALVAHERRTGHGGGRGRPVAADLRPPGREGDDGDRHRRLGAPLRTLGARGLVRIPDRGGRAARRLLRLRPHRRDDLRRPGLPPRRPGQRAEPPQPAGGRQRRLPGQLPDRRRRDPLYPRGGLGLALDLAGPHGRLRRGAPRLPGRIPRPPARRGCRHPREVIVPLRYARRVDSGK